MFKKVAVFNIDGQIDFMDLPGSALPVTGACKDMDRVAVLVERLGNKITSIHETLDSHHTLHIAHPVWWLTAAGSEVGVFTQITTDDIKNGKYTARISPKWSYDYIEQLEKQGEFIHTIWPFHCRIGTPGAALYGPLEAAFTAWEKKYTKVVDFVTKGDNPYTEHFGALRANIEIPSAPSTQLNQGLIKALMENDIVLFTGEAKSHCVANTLRQIVKEASALAPKLVILTDCMSDVTGLPQGFYDSVQVIYDDAKAAGVQFEKSTNITI